MRVADPKAPFLASTKAKRNKRFYNKSLAVFGFSRDTSRVVFLKMVFDHDSNIVRHRIGQISCRLFVGFALRHASRKIGALSYVATIQLILLDCECYTQIATFLDEVVVFFADIHRSLWKCPSLR